MLWDNLQCMNFRVGSLRLHSLLNLSALVVLASSLLRGGDGKAQTTTKAYAGPAILSPTHPKDSLGDPVYETRGEKDKDEPAVAGVFVSPVAISLPEPKYPKALRKTKSTADVTVLMVITPAGEVIDPEVTGTTDQDASSAALDAVRKYRFKPATLDGKPVASLAKVVVYFRIR